MRTFTILALVGLLLAGTACDNGWTGGWGKKDQPQAEPEATAATDEADASGQPAQATEADTQADAVRAQPADDTPVVVIETDKGPIVVELYATKAPKTVENFLTYVQDDFYGGTIVHRVIPGFMIQGGGMTPDMQRKDTHAPIRNEADNGLKNERGTIAMARTNDPHSATSQFFINHRDNPALNHTAKTPTGWGYCVFGRVIDGMNVVDAIAGAATTTRAGHKDVPVEPVVIKHVYRMGDGSK
ncbi:MAG: peptidyl-prolyl cis-trans isomerase [Planctomycetes bacterium]|jgi:peptidyl-prolyl cis-trans isomerase B (cyclophilin B)|nr:peptidyl-prolyl cis-trans isomerase [Phycisphaerae bacterium]NBB96093.1 peptidyl-prolyl cis-trans isomerase [Planctomycetota bacterium]